MKDASELGPVPFSEGQVQYLEEVLGVAAGAYRVRALAGEDITAAMREIEHTHPTELARPAEFVVLTPALTDQARELLGKILASIQLAEIPVHEMDEPPSTAPRARHVLTFFGSPPAGRARQGDVTWWNFPLLGDMLAGASRMTELKKQTWALLQMLNGERNT